MNFLSSINIGSKKVHLLMRKCYIIIILSNLDTKEFQLVEQLFQASVAAKTDMYDQNRIVRSVNWEIVNLMTQNHMLDYLIFLAD